MFCLFLHFYRRRRLHLFLEIEYSCCHRVKGILRALQPSHTLVVIVPIIPFFDAESVAGESHASFCIYVIDYEINLTVMMRKVKHDNIISFHLPHSPYPLGAFLKHNVIDNRTTTNKIFFFILIKI